MRNLEKSVDRRHPATRQVPWSSAVKDGGDTVFSLLAVQNPLNSFRSDDPLAKVNCGHEEIQLGDSMQRGRDATFSVHGIDRHCHEITEGPTEYFESTLSEHNVDIRNLRKQQKQIAPE